MSAADYIVVGAGSAGCAAAAGLSLAGRVLVLEAGPGDWHPLVRVPMGLIWLMGSARDWRYRSASQAALDGRRVAVPRGRMLGGSGAINSMVWFRGRADDFDAWNLPGWRWADVRPAFEAVEAVMRPAPLRTPHALARAFGDGPPSPERESAGLCRYNMAHGRRRSAADAFLRPALRRGAALRLRAPVDRLCFRAGRARGVVLADGSELQATRGVVLSAGAIGTPAILIRSGIGPRADLARLGIDPVTEAEGVGGNLHDHPAVAVHHAGPRSGYGLSLATAPGWALAPLRYALGGGAGPLGSPTVEACAFLDASGTGTPDVQVHFIPFMIGWQGRAIVPGQGYYADVCVSRPRSRGRLRLTSRDPAMAPEIDLGLLRDPADMALLIRGLRRLRAFLADAPFGAARAPEAFPGPDCADDAALAAHIRARAGTSYHPVGTARMGAGPDAPVAPDLAVRGVGDLWVADASIMPRVTSANTNAPAMMIGHRAGALIGAAA
ncbi:MAG: GMC family oxidoreductase N-terminal domain-containing protein [Pseudomonadota bacterium]